MHWFRYYGADEAFSYIINLYWIYLLFIYESYTIAQESTSFWIYIRFNLLFYCVESSTSESR